jgi:two-component system phosphate regulon sensor histidine kinase PhoR
MEPLAAVLALALAVAVAIIMLRDRRARRERAALERELREMVPRSELSAALASRDAVMAAASTPILLFDNEGQVVRANPAAREAGPELAGPATQPDLAAATVRGAAGEPVRDVELTVYTPERRRFRARIRGFGSGADAGAAVVLSDQSSEADYRDARRLFSAGVSHELRTPLQRILALVETLALPLGDDERSDMIAQARAEVDAMRQLIEDMILLVRLESHELADKDEQTDVTAAVEACVTRHTPAARAASMSLGTAVTRGLVAAVAPRLVDAVLDNLVENAIHHAGQGEAVVVRARGLSGAVEIVVHDTGGRIPPDHLARVFERFYRVEDARSGPGTGLGLAIVKHIAEEYGGRATADSSPAGGTNIRVVLPAPAAVRD